MHKEANDFLVHERFKRYSTFFFGHFFLTINLDYTLKITSVLHLESSGSLNPSLTTTTYLLLNIIFLGFFVVYFFNSFAPSFFSIDFYKFKRGHGRYYILLSHISMLLYFFHMHDTS